MAALGVGVGAWILGWGAAALRAGARPTPEGDESAACRAAVAAPVVALFVHAAILWLVARSGRSVELYDSEPYRFLCLAATAVACTAGFIASLALPLRKRGWWIRSSATVATSAGAFCVAAFVTAIVLRFERR